MHATDDLRRNLDQIPLLKNIIDLSPAITFIWEPSEGWPVLYVSANVSNLGYQVDDFLTGKIKYDQLIHPDDMRRVTSEVENAMQSERDRFDQRYRIVTADGKTRLIHDWTILDRDNTGIVQAIGGVIADITDNDQADERARKYLDTTSDLYLRVDFRGQVLDVNEKTCDLIGLSKDEMLKSNWLNSFVPEEARPGVIDAMRDISEDEAQGVQEYENDVISASGKRYRIHWYYSRDASIETQSAGIDAFGADITEEIKALSVAGELSKTLMENPNPVLRISAERDIEFANEAAQNLIGRISELDEIARANWDNLVEAAIKAESRVNHELRIDHQSYLFSICPSDENTSFNCYGIDTTDQKNLSNTITNISENIPGALFTYSVDANGKDQISYMSPGCESLWELRAEELQGDPSAIWAQVHPDDLADLQHSITSSMETLHRWRHEWRIKTPSGKLKWLNASATPERLPDGGTRWTTIIIDVTESKNSAAAISDALRKTIYVLSAAFEARDPYTAGHEQRVTYIAVQIGRELKLDKHLLTGLELAATVHDVGKIRIPAEILSKPGRLNEPEMALIRTHPEVGAELLDCIEFDWPISTIIRQHHERMDGSGYPDGLSGDDILLESRIIAVADTLEAMASHRPYRPSLGMAKATEEIRRGAGKIYDAEVARACLKLIEEGKINFEEASLSQQG